MPGLVWLRRDLRRRDLPLLAEAAASDGSAAVVFVLDDRWARLSTARRAWLARNLLSLRASYEERLCLRFGDPAIVIGQVASEVAAACVHVSNESEPDGAMRDAAVRAALAELGVALVATGSPYAVTPGRLRSSSGGGFKVFTPFSRAWREHGWREPAQEPSTLRLLDVASDECAWAMVRDAASAPGLPDMPAAGEQAALERWDQFLAEGLETYDSTRDRPDLDGTSRMSPYLALGVVHPRTLLADLAGNDGPGVQRFITELAWREFYADVLAQFPDSLHHDLRPELAGLAYDDDPGELDAWQHGRTGYPIVDAGMRQLLATGWMHNRVRMITASFLTKDLHQWWPVGARWFDDHLIDADAASNSHGWQWTAGTGTDAAPYFRVFNPVLQGEKFDPDGDYVRRWVPELAHLRGKASHEPWKHPGGYRNGYPGRIVDHAQERAETLARYHASRQARGATPS